MSKIKEIVLDTETTGLDPYPTDTNPTGHRVIEIGAVELLGHVPTGKKFHKYLNPEMNVPKESTMIHGITTEDLLDKPKFQTIADDFLNFISGGVLIIHNAEFDLKFLNYELKKANKDDLSNFAIIDTLQLARQKFPSGRNSLDALANRFGVNKSARKDFHGALVDTNILSEVYLELIGGSQPDILSEVYLEPIGGPQPDLELPSPELTPENNQRSKKLTKRLKEDEIKAHSNFIKSIGGEKNWNY